MGGNVVLALSELDRSREAVRHNRNQECKTELRDAIQFSDSLKLNLSNGIQSTFSLKKTIQMNRINGKTSAKSFENQITSSTPNLNIDLDDSFDAHF